MADDERDAVLSHELLRTAIREGIAESPDPVAPGAGPGRADLADAYLGLLKLALCDLVAPRTMSVRRTPLGVASEELRDAWVKVRCDGRDWPRYGLSMAGLSRLNDLQACVRSVVADGVPGDVIETGTWRGGASILMRATLDTLGDEREVWVADSFAGFREDLRSEDLAELDFLAVSLEEVKANFERLGLDRRVTFLPGYFEDTLPALERRPWAICRLDGDSYEATRVCLETLYPTLSPGGYLIVDDYYVLDECRAAVDEFRAEHGIGEPLEKVDWTCARWRREDERPIEPSPRNAPRPAEGTAAPTPERPPYTPVPTVEELSLRRDVDALRRRLAEVERALEQERNAPLVRLGRRLRGRRG